MTTTLIPTRAPSGRSRTGRAGRGERLAFITPVFLLLLVGFVAPLALLIPQSFTDASGFTLGAYERFFTRSIYLEVIGNTARIAGLTALFSILAGYPLALWISRLGSRGKIIAIVAVVLPFWVSILVRTYSWTVLLGKEGVINTALLKLGLIAEPLSLLYTDVGVLIGTVNLLAPFLILPLIATMSGIDPRLGQAARSLGASPTQAFWRVFFPQTVPTLVATSFLVFVLGFGFYITPAILGGGRVQMLPTVLAGLINTSPDWAVAAAISIVLLVGAGLIGLLAKLVTRRTT